MLKTFTVARTETTRDRNGKESRPVRRGTKESQAGTSARDQNSKCAEPVHRSTMEAQANARACDRNGEGSGIVSPITTEAQAVARTVTECVKPRQPRRLKMWSLDFINGVGDYKACGRAAVFMRRNIGSPKWDAPFY